MSQGVELAEAIQQLRQELNKAIDQAAQEKLRFDLGAVELELTIAIERSTEVGGQVRFVVFDAGASGTHSNATTQRVRLVLNPRVADAPGERVSISGATVPGER